MDDNHRKIEENNSWNKLSKWDEIVEDRIRKVIGDGNMSWHPKAGEPLEFEDNSLIPEEMKLTHKIMQDNEAVPPWMSLRFTLRDKYAKIAKRVRQYARDYVARRKKAISMGSFILQNEADERWQNATRQLGMNIASYNSELLNYNLRIPKGIDQIIPLDASAIIASALSEAEK